MEQQLKRKGKNNVVRRSTRTAAKLATAASKAEKPLQQQNRDSKQGSQQGMMEGKTTVINRRKPGPKPKRCILFEDFCASTDNYASNCDLEGGPPLNKVGTPSTKRRQSVLTRFAEPNTQSRVQHNAAGRLLKKTVTKCEQLAEIGEEDSELSESKLESVKKEPAKRKKGPPGKKRKQEQTLKVQRPTDLWDNSAVRRMNQDFDSASGFDLKTSAGSGVKNWLHLDRIASESESSSRPPPTAVVASANSASCASETHKKQSAAVHMVTSTPLADKDNKRQPMRGVIAAEAMENVSDLDVSAIRFDSAYDDLLDSPALKPECIYKSPTVEPAGCATINEEEGSMDGLLNSSAKYKDLEEITAIAQIQDNVHWAHVDQSLAKCDFVNSPLSPGKTYRPDNKADYAAVRRISAVFGANTATKPLVLPELVIEEDVDDENVPPATGKFVIAANKKAEQQRCREPRSSDDLFSSGNWSEPKSSAAESVSDNEKKTKANSIGNSFTAASNTVIENVEVVTDAGKQEEKQNGETDDEVVEDNEGTANADTDLADHSTAPVRPSTRSAPACRKTKTTDRLLSLIGLQLRPKDAGDDMQNLSAMLEEASIDDTDEEEDKQVSSEEDDEGHEEDDGIERSSSVHGSADSGSEADVSMGSTTEANASKSQSQALVDYAATMSDDTDNVDNLLVNPDYTVDSNASVAAKRNFSRLDVVDGGSPYYMYGRANERSPMDDLLHVCNQRRLITWDEAFSQCLLDSAKKIGEGVYGEVFRSRNKDGVSVAIKIIPIEGNFDVNGERQKSFEEILPEVLIAREMSQLTDNPQFSTPNFVPVLRNMVVSGAYPEQLLVAWEEYSMRKMSENDCPDVFTDDQLFVVLEFGDGGEDLDSFKFTNSDQARSVFLQTALCLAVAEEAIRFEHRDLHIGNILVSKTNQQFIEYMYSDRSIKVESKGVHVYIIDFTNSRLEKEGCTIFTDLAMDEEMFNGPDNEYQFDIYRMMRTINNNVWKDYHPRTNVFWLHYLLDKLIEVKKYSGRKLTGAKKADFLCVKDDVIQYEHTSQMLGVSEPLYSWEQQLCSNF